MSLSVSCFTRMTFNIFALFSVSIVPNSNLPTDCSRSHSETAGEESRQVHSTFSQSKRDSRVLRLTRSFISFRDHPIILLLITKTKWFLCKKYTKRWLSKTAITDLVDSHSILHPALSMNDQGPHLIQQHSVANRQAALFKSLPGAFGQFDSSNLLYIHQTK